MKSSLFFLLLLSAFGLAAEDPMKSADRFTELDVFQLEYASDPQISPDGKRIVYVRNSMDIMSDRRRSDIWIVDFDGSRHRPLVAEEASESSPRWSPDGTKLAFVSRAGGKGPSQIYLRWMDNGLTARLTQLTKAPGGLSWSPDGRWIAFSMLVPSAPPKLAEMPPQPQGAQWADPPRVINRLRNRADGRGYLEHGFSHLFLLPAEGGTPRQVTSGAFHIQGPPVWTPDGKSLLFTSNRNPDWEYEFRNSEIYSVSVENGEIRALTDRDGPDRSPAVSPDGRYVAYVGLDDRLQTYQVARLSIMNADGTGKRVLVSGLDRGAASPVWDPSGGGVYFQYDDLGNSKIAYATMEGQVSVLAGDLGGASLGRPYGGGSFSVAPDGRFAFTQTRPEYPGDVAVGRRGSSEVRRITRLNEDLLDHKKLGDVEEIWYRSSFDGRRIQGWIVKPPDFDPAGKYPLILEIHGGPISNYGDRFTAEIQLYASAGYVVLYANPRGSTSYGEEFGNLLHHNYPGQDYDDLISGVDAVIARGYLDEKRLYVTGGSAGGIMTAWIVGKTQRFRAAVAAKPVINWISKTLVADNYYAYHRYRYPGYAWENPEAYWKFSPISLVGNVSTPTLLMTGDADLRTPLSEAEQFYHALKLRRVETALVRIPGASHNITRRPSQLIAKVAHVLAWFEKYRE